MYESVLKDHNLSVTAVRVAVLEALDMHPHAGADQIYNVVKDKIATVSKQAIYNNMNTLVEHGLIREIKPKGQPTLYETRVNDDHHHIVCKHCQCVMDTDCAMPSLTPRNKHGFVIDETEIIFWGICPDCQQSTNTKRRKS